MCGIPGHFRSDCLGNLTPGAYTSEGNLFSAKGPLQTGQGLGQLSCLRAIPLEMPLLSTVIVSPSLFTWVPLGFFLRLFQSRSNSLGLQSFLPGSLFPSIFLLLHFEDLTLVNLPERLPSSVLGVYPGLSFSLFCVSKLSIV